MKHWIIVFLITLSLVVTLPAVSAKEDAPAEPVKALKHTNSKGAVYFLRSTVTKSKNGKERTFYYFTKKEHPEKGQPVGVLPEGYQISETKNGLPVLKKSAKKASK